MTTRIYLQAVRMLPGPPEEGDLLAERVFIHASGPPEIHDTDAHRRNRSERLRPVDSQSSGRQVEQKSSPNGVRWIDRRTVFGARPARVIAAWTSGWTSTTW